MIENVKRNRDGSISADIDGAAICFADDFADRFRRQLAEEWEALGNVIPPYVEPLPGVDDYKLAVVAHLDAKAQERRYDNAVSIATYTASTNPQWAAEAAAFVPWRDAVWTYAYAELDKVMNGQRLQPTVADLIGELPALSWPA